MLPTQTKETRWEQGPERLLEIELLIRSARQRSELLEEAQIAGGGPATRTNSATSVHHPNNSEENSIDDEESELSRIGHLLSIGMAFLKRNSYF